MRGGGSWLPLFWLMVAFLVIVKLADTLLPHIKKRYKTWRARKHPDHEFP